MLVYCYSVCKDTDFSQNSKTIRQQFTDRHNHRPPDMPTADDAITAYHWGLAPVIGTKGRSHCDTNVTWMQRFSLDFVNF